MSDKYNEKEKIYAALKLIENLYKNGRIKKHIFLNIIDEYKDYIDISEFQWYNIDTQIAEYTYLNSTLQEE